MSDVGALIKQNRIRLGMTQEELAKKVGVQKSCIAKWENGRVSEIKRSNLSALADALHLKPTALLGTIHTAPISVAAQLAAIYEDPELRLMIKEFNKLDETKKQQVREYIHLLAEKVKS